MNASVDHALSGFPVVLLNGPPRCGKDTAAKAIQHGIRGTAVLRMSGPLKRATHVLFGLDGVDHDAYEDVKDQPHQHFRGMTPRAAYIAMSETGVKPAFGNTHFGEVLVSQLARRLPSTKLVAVPDSGFRAEALPVADAVGADSVLLIRIHRPGRTFAGDSRGYINLPGVRAVNVYNEGSAAAFELDIVDVVKQWLVARQRAAAGC